MMSKTVSKVWLLLVVLGVVLISSLQPDYKLGFFNGTNSAPKGFYKIVADTGELKYGDYVIIDVPKEVQPVVYGRWLHEGTPLLKKVGALSGDTVMIGDNGLFINGNYIGPVLAQDRAGLPLPQLRGQFQIKPGDFLPVSPYERSFDGRYFGPVPVSSILHKVEPLLTY